MFRKSSLLIANVPGLILSPCLLAAVVMAASCSNYTASSPTAPLPVPVVTNPVPPPTPPSSGPFPGPGTYVFVETPGVSVQPYTAASRFVLGADGTFGLEMPGYVYRGRYTEQDGRLTFAWNDWGAGSATGVFTGDTLLVTYNDYLWLTDFENARYVRIP